MHANNDLTLEPTRTDKSVAAIRNNTCLLTNIYATRAARTPRGATARAHPDAESKE